MTDIVNPARIAEIIDFLKGLNSKNAVVVTINNRTDKTLILSAVQENSGSFATQPEPEIPSGGEDVFGWAERQGSLFTGADGIVTYDVGDDGTKWAVHFNNPQFGTNSASSTISPPGDAIYTKLDLSGSGDQAQMSFTIRKPGFTPSTPGSQPTDVVSRCIITVVNHTESVLTLADQGHERGNFFTFPKAQLQPGETDSFGSVETQGVTDPKEQGSAGFLVYDIGAPGGGKWTSRWDNPEKAANTSSSEVTDAPEGTAYTALDQIGEGEDNVPVTFTLSGGPTGPQPVHEAEWAPPTEVEQPTLRRGDDNPDGWVEYLQELLNQKLGAGLVVDGDFGGGTQAAVNKLQREFDIQEDGVVGNQTWAVLRGETPVPASTDGRAPHSHVEHGAEARFRGEGQQGGSGYDASSDSVTLNVVSVGDTRIDDAVITVRVTGNDSGEVWVGDSALGAPVHVHPTGGADYSVTVSDIRAAYGAGTHTLEAYLPAELGGDYITFQMVVP